MLDRNDIDGTTIYQHFRLKKRSEVKRVSSVIAYFEPHTSPSEIESNGVSYFFLTYDAPLDVPTEKYLTAEEYPRLAEIWDNDDDAIYDNM